jgi:hypothetical protein
VEALDSDFSVSNTIHPSSPQSHRKPQPCACHWNPHQKPRFGVQFGNKSVPFAVKWENAQAMHLALDFMRNMIWKRQRLFQPRLHALRGSPGAPSCKQRAWPRPAGPRPTSGSQLWVNPTLARSLPGLAWGRSQWLTKLFDQRRV